MLARLVQARLRATREQCASTELGCVRLTGSRAVRSSIRADSTASSIRRSATRGGRPPASAASTEGVMRWAGPKPATESQTAPVPRPHEGADTQHLPLQPERSSDVESATRARRSRAYRPRLLSRGRTRSALPTQRPLRPCRRLKRESTLRSEHGQPMVVPSLTDSDRRGLCALRSSPLSWEPMRLRKWHLATRRDCHTDPSSGLDSGWSMPA
jgi:hypothetical protein